MPDTVRKLERARRDARRFAADARRLAARAGARLPKGVREEVAAACDEVDAVAKGGDPERLSAALHALDGLWNDHLAALGKPAWREYAEVVLAAVALALLVRAFVFEAYRIPSGSMAPTLLAGDHVLVSKLAYGLRVPLLGVRLAGTPPRRGDVVVFESPRAPGADLVKRVAGVPGDVVELREEVLFVNGVPQPRTPEGEVAFEERSAAPGALVVETCRRYREALARGPLSSVGDGAAALEARWDAAAAAGVATHEVLQCNPTRPASRQGPYQVVAPGHLFVLGDNRDRSADGRAAGGSQVPLERVRGRVSVVFFSWADRGGTSRGGPRLGRMFERVE